MKYLLLFSCLVVMNCTDKVKSAENIQTAEDTVNLIAVLDTIWNTEQQPIRLRDSLMEKYGAESELVLEQQKIYEQNHIINERKVKAILDTICKMR